MIWFIVFLVQIALLLFLSSSTKKFLFSLIYQTSRSTSFSVALISLLLYPGVVVHELSHLVAAIVLFVPVKSMTLIPKVLEGKIQGGSVVIQKVDVFRRTLVGVAPLFGGLVILWLITAYLVPLSFLCQNFLSSDSQWFEILRLPTVAQNDVLCSVNKFFLIPNSQILTTSFALYLLFSISATMYSSQKDLEAMLYTLPIGIVGIVFLYIIGFQISWVVSLLGRFERVFTTLSMILVLVLVIQFIVYLLLLLYSTVRKPMRVG